MDPIVICSRSVKFSHFEKYFLSIIWILEDNKYISSLAPPGLLFNIQWWKSDNSYCVKHIIKNWKWMSSFNFEKYLSIKIWFLRIIFCFRNIKNKNFTLLILALVSAVGWYRLHSFVFGWYQPLGLLPGQRSKQQCDILYQLVEKER